VETGGPVEDDPGLELAIGDRVTHVGDVGSSGGIPVDAAHVVAGRVLAAVSRLGSRCRQQAEVIALQEPVEAAIDLQLEEPQGRLRATERGWHGEGHAVRSSSGTGTAVGVGTTRPACRGATFGIATVASRRCTMRSESIPSASASYDRT